SGLCAGTYTVTITDSGTNLGTAPDWTFVNTSLNHIILVASDADITIGGSPIQVGDYIGVFYNTPNGLACGSGTGTGTNLSAGTMWDGNVTSITAWGTEAGMNNGFADDEAFKWKIWRASDGMQFNAVATYLTTFANQGNYATNGISGLASLTAVLPGIPAGSASQQIILSATVYEPDQLVAYADATPILCNGGSSWVTVTATGGTEPYTGTGVFEVTAGMQTFNVYDAHQCMTSVTINITEPDPLIAGGSAYPISCNGDWTSLFIYATGGTAPYYGEGYFYVPAGTYSYTITDANQCHAGVTVTVTEPDPLMAYAQATDILCNGEMADVTVSASGGIEPYTGTGDFTVSAGTNYLYVYDANGCQTIVTVNITEPDMLIASASATPIMCNGGTSVVTVSATGGTEPYYGTGDFTEYAGDYTFTVTDANGCFYEVNVTITEPDPLVVVEEFGDQITCNGGDALAYITASGGTGPYTGTGYYSVVAGTHTFTVYDANQCSAEITITWTEPADPLVAYASATDILCNGDLTTINIWATGGTPPYMVPGPFYFFAGNFSFTVYDANNCMASVNITVTQPEALTASAVTTPIMCNGGTSVVTISAIGGTEPYTGTGDFTEYAGNYTYTVTDANGCFYEVSITITEPEALQVMSSANPIFCNGDLTMVFVSASGGTAPYSGVGFFQEGAGTYTYPVYDANQCYSETTITIDQPTALSVTYTSTSIACFGGYSDVDIIATGGTPPYIWDGMYNQYAGSTIYTVFDSNDCMTSVTVTLTEPDMLIASASATPILCNGGTSVVTVTATGGTEPYFGTGQFTEFAGDYSYSVTDANGCSFEVYVTITEPDILQVTSSAYPIYCNGDMTMVYVSATGGTAPYTGDGFFQVGAGTYTFPVYDANQCYSETTITIDQPTALSVAFTASPIACFGGYSDVNIVVTGGTPPYLGDGTFVQQAGTNTYNIFDYYQCMTSLTVTVSQPSQLLAYVNATSINCNGGTSQVTVDATGGTTPYSGTGTFTETAGMHTFTVIDANGCTFEVTINITEPTVLMAMADYPMWVCPGNPALVNISAMGGTAPYFNTGQYSYPSGTHTVTISDMNGCTASTTFTIGEYPAPVVNLGPDFNLTAGNSATLDAGAGFISYLWSDGSTDQTLTIFTGGTYSVTVTNNYGCTGSDQVVVTEVIVYPCQNISLTTNSNIISTYILPVPNANIASVFAPLAVPDPNHGNLRAISLVKDGNGNPWWPQYGLNNIGNMVIGKGYQFIMNFAASIDVCGNISVPQTTPIFLPSYWAMIGYIRTTSAPIVSMFSSIPTSHVYVVKDNAGHIWWPQYNINTIGNMLVGQGYKTLMYVSSTLYYPADASSYAKAEPYGFFNEHYVNAPSETGNNMTLGIPLSAWNELPVIGDEIGVYDGFNLVGESVFDGGNIAVTIWGYNEYIDGSAGMNDNSDFTIKLWSRSSGEEQTLAVTSWLTGNNTYTTDGISVVAKLTAVQAINNDFVLYQNQPNPFSQTTTIRFSLPVDTHVTITVYNVLGEKVEEILSEVMSAGDYRIQLNADKYRAGEYFYRIITPEFTSTKTMNVVK
ncbi:MAG: T9SS type A sorting domain-containing protein, partial [Bacteroidia bacterium]|nr:T9SS type A sorting domain-containing protein [Bacteroidia bacterium]